MRRLAAAAFAITTVLGLGATAVTADAAPTSPSVSTAAAPYIVVLDDSADARAVAPAQASRFGFDLGHVYTSALQGYSATMSPAVAEALEALPARRAGCSRTGRSAIDAQTTPTGINRANADASPTAAINGVDQRVNVDVAVIDTGADLDHPDLNVNRAGAKNCSHRRDQRQRPDTATAPTSRAPSARSTTPPAWSAWRRAPGSGRSRCSPTPAAA